MRQLVLVLCLAGTTAACNSSSPSPTAPTPPPAPSVTAVTVSGTPTLLEQKGATAQFTATVTLSSGATEDRTATVTWRSDNPSVAAVSPQGVVTAEGEGETVISATVGEVRGTRGVSVRLPRRTPDPAPGQRIPLPDIRATVQQINAARPELLAPQSCPQGLKYITNPWLDYIVDELRKLDTRWGYNAKPVKSASDNGGVPVVAAGDEIAYHFGAGPDEGSTEVYLIDILEGHCGPTPRLTYRHFTGEEPGRWTGAGRF